MAFDVEPLFSIPVARTILYNVDRNIKTYLINQPFQKVRNGCCSYSVNKRVLDDPACFHLKQLLEIQLNEYLTQIQGIDIDNFPIHIKTSWIIKMEPDNFADEHYHSKSLFTGVLYLNGSEKGTDTIPNLNFARPSSAANQSKNFFEWPIKNWNIYNCESFYVKPAKDMLVMFPSNLGHSADTNTSNETLYCLVFDTFPKGSFDVGLPGELHLP